jgi:ribosomal protein S18 acetylase RimI-like enzyme
MTDVLGTLETWADDHLTVRREDGTLTRVRRADLVSGKAVPPRPSVRHRVPAAEAARRALGSWPAVETRPLGDWVLRASDGFSARANSVFLTGDPGRPWDEAVSVAAAFYADHGLPAWAQVLVGSAEAERAQAEGWRHARPGEADSLFQVASVAQAVRRTREIRSQDRSEATSYGVSGEMNVLVNDLVTTLGAEISEGWLATDDRARAHPEAARAVLEGPDHVAFATVERDGVVVARGRAAMPEADDWVGVTDVWVDPEHRRGGLAHLVLSELLPWAAELGASTAYLQVRADNVGGLALYDRLSFVTHHAYRYLELPVTGR